MPDEMRNKLWVEACNHATNTEYKLVNVGCNTSAYKQFYKQQSPPLCPHQFGELAVVWDTDHIKGKMRNKGNKCMFVDETDSHSNEVYKFLNLKTKQIIRNRNVIWLNKLYSNTTTYSNKK